MQPPLSHSNAVHRIHTKASDTWLSSPEFCHQMFALVNMKCNFPFFLLSFKSKKIKKLNDIENKNCNNVKMIKKKQNTISENSKKE